MNLVFKARLVHLVYSLCASQGHTSSLKQQGYKKHLQYAEFSDSNNLFTLWKLSWMTTIELEHIRETSIVGS